jgi:hypothetical protein
MSALTPKADITQRSDLMSFQTSIISFDHFAFDPPPSKDTDSFGFGSMIPIGLSVPARQPVTGSIIDAGRGYDLLSAARWQGVAVAQCKKTERNDGFRASADDFTTRMRLLMRPRPAAQR